jgi:hypothetical protein
MYSKQKSIEIKAVIILHGFQKGSAFFSIFKAYKYQEGTFQK